MRKSRILFWMLALAQCVLWVVFSQISQDFVYGENHSERPLLPILGVIFLAFALYLACGFRFWNEKKWLNSWHILLIAVFLRVPLVFWSEPVQEIDYYRYLWDGRALVSGVSPYRFSPADLDDFTALSEEDRPEDAARLIRVIERSPAMATAFERIDHREVPTIYPPASQLVFSAAALVTPEGASIKLHLIVLRGLMSCLDLGVVAMLLIFLKWRQLPLGRAIVYAWCPLVLKEFSNSAHMDVIAIFLVTAAWLILSRQTGEKGKWPGVKVHVSALLWSCGVLAKWYPLVLAPVLLSFGWKRWRWRFALPFLVALLVIGAGVQFSRLNTESRERSSVSHDELTGLRTFLSRWEMNDFTFSFVRDNLDVRESKSDLGLKDREPWYAFVPKKERLKWDSAFRAVARRVGLAESVDDPAFLTAQILSGIAVFLAALWLSFRPWPEKDVSEELARRMFLILAVWWLVSATQNPWYWAWGLPFLVFAKSRVWLFVSGASLIYYLRFWLIYQYPSPMWRGLDGGQVFDEIVVWFEHLPIILLLLFSGIISASHASNKKRAGALTTSHH